MNLKMPSYLNQVWNFFTNEAGEIQVISGEISENAPISYDESICTLEESPEAEKRAKLIARAPDMFKILCNLGGEIDDGAALVPDFIAEDIDNVISEVIRKK